jgi:hypothetical protein
MPITNKLYVFLYGGKFYVVFARNIDDLVKLIQRCDRCGADVLFNPILHTAWLNNHALTLKRNTAKYYFGEKSSFLHTFLKISCESRKI